MEPLSWTGSLSFLTPILFLSLAALGVSIIAWMVLSVAGGMRASAQGPYGAPALTATPEGLAALGVRLSLLAAVAIVLIHIVFGILFGTAGGIIGAMSQLMLPVCRS